MDNTNEPRGAGENTNEILRLRREKFDNMMAEGKDPFQQPRILKEVMNSRSYSSRIRKIVKGFMVESYLEPGCQKIGEGVYGKSITDPCLGWEKTERLILEMADLL